MSDNPSDEMVCFEIEGLTPNQTVERLKERGVVASTTPPYKYKYARINGEPVELPSRTQLAQFGFADLLPQDYIQNPVIICSSATGPRRINVGKQETGRSRKDAAPAAV